MTDPACPFAFSAEPVRWRLRWHYGDPLVWRTRMIVLTREPGEAERLAEGAPNLQRIHGMPIDPRPYPRTASSEPACLAVVAARERAPGSEERLLRRLRVRVMLGLVDDPELIAAAAEDAGLDPARAGRVVRDARGTRGARGRHRRGARSPSAAARALDHKLGGPRGAAPLHGSELRARVRRRTASVPGFNPVEAYEAAIANLAPGARAPPAAGARRRGARVGG